MQKKQRRNEQRRDVSASSSDDDVEYRRTKRRSCELRQKRDRSHDEENVRKRQKPDRRSGISDRRRKDYLKLDRYDGTTALETFRIQFETCSDYNGRSECDKLAQLKAALRGSAAQVLLGDGEPLTCEELWTDLQQNFGTSGHEAQFESQLKVRRRLKGESLRSLYQDINRLTLQAYPDSKGRLREKLAIEAFIVGLNNSELALQVRNLCPVDLQEAYRKALMLESNRSLVERSEESKDRKKDTRYDVSARAVSEEDSELFHRVRRLEERFLEHKAAPQAKRDVQESAGFEVKVSNLERDIEMLKSRQIGMNSPNRNVDGFMQPTSSSTVERQGGIVWSNFTINSYSGGPQEMAPTSGANYSTGGFPGANYRETPRVIICYNCGLPGHKYSLCPQRPCQHCRQQGHTLRQCPVFEPHRKNNLCFTCGGAGHRSRNCLQSKQPRRAGESFSAMKLACAAGAADGEHRVYLKMRIGGTERQFLLDSGCDTTIVPLEFVRNVPLRPTRKTVSAANGTTIELAGEVSIRLQLGDLSIPTTALVSEYVSEGMIGYDWLQENDCYWGFRVGQIMIRERIFQLIGGAGTSSCCRVIAQESVVIPRCSETILMSKAVFSGNQFGQKKESVEFVSEPRELENGVYVGRALIPHRCTDIPMRVLNPSNRDVVLQRDCTIAELEPVKILESHRMSDCRFSGNDWTQKLLEEVDSDVTAPERNELIGILSEYSDCFSKDEFDLGQTTLVKHRIETGCNPPIRQALRRQPLTHLSEIDRQLTEMLHQGIVEPSSSPWSSNVVIVAKKDGSLRFCVDYRGLNGVTRKDSYPLPRISDCLDVLGSATFFRTFDLRSGYFQIGMDEADRDKTSFVTRRGTFRFTAMPFGLCNAPATFQRVMDVAMAGLNYEICLVYLDDIVLFSKTVKEHLERLRLIFDRLRRANLKLKPSKCHLLKKTVTFLGHVISENGVATDPTKIDGVLSWPVPRNVTEVRSFLGLCSYYRRFVKDFAMIAAPLHALTGKNARFYWSENCQEAFDVLKERLVSAPILAMPKDEGEYWLDTDASNFSIGAVLSQVQDGEERVIAYASRLLNAPEKNYCVTRRELLAVVFFTKYFRSYLLGRDFTIRTDHSALRWLKTTPEPIGQQARWLERLEEFTYRIEHRPGNKHGNADALSRRPCRQCSRGEHGSSGGSDESETMLKSVINSEEHGPPGGSDEQDVDAPDRESSDESKREPPERKRSDYTVTMLKSMRDVKQLDAIRRTDESEKGDVAVRNVHFAEPQEDSEWNLEKLRAAYENDPELADIYRLISENEERVPWDNVVGLDRLTKSYWQQWERLRLNDGLLYREWSSLDGTHHSFQWIPPVSSRDRLMEIAHSGRTGGHLGIKRTKKQLQRGAYWTGWAADVERYCKRCVECSCYHRCPPKRQGLLQVTTVGEPMERIAIDLTGPHPTSRSSNVYILTVLDLFSKWAEAIPLRNKEAVTVARALSDVVFSRIGLPIQLLSDNGREFENTLMSELCRLLGIEKLKTTAYKASTNGAVERFHRTLNSMIAKVVAGNQRNWDELLPSVMAAYRSSRHEATGFTPNYLMFGREVRAPIDLVYGIPEEEAQHYDSHDAFVSDKVQKMRDAYKLTREHLGAGAERMKNYYDMRVKPTVFNRNTWVYYYNPRRYVGKSPKWQKFYTGPFLIVRTFGSVNVVLQLNKRSRPFTAHVDKLKLCLGPTPVSWLAEVPEEDSDEAAPFIKAGGSEVTGELNSGGTDFNAVKSDGIEADGAEVLREAASDGTEVVEAALGERNAGGSEVIEILEAQLIDSQETSCEILPLERRVERDVDTQVSDRKRCESDRPRRMIVRPRYLENYQ